MITLFTKTRTHRFVIKDKGAAWFWSKKALIPET